jgi:hypothetical protein
VNPAAPFLIGGGGGEGRGGGGGGNRPPGVGILIGDSAKNGAGKGNSIKFVGANRGGLGGGTGGVRKKWRKRRRVIPMPIRLRLAFRLGIGINLKKIDLLIIFEF